jgi:PPK2 family polyphosphate:nucleotide phosphotransferase
MWTAPPSPYLVPADGSFRVAKSPTGPPEGEHDGKRAKRQLAELMEELDELSRVLYANDRVAVLCVFQAMDAAGKDGTIRDVFTGVDPSSLEIHYFKQPSHEELDHDFLWRTARRLPSRGRIGVINRSYYEETLVVRVHPELLGHQRLPWRPKGSKLWTERFASIRDHEHHLARNGTVVLKFWLNVSREEQRRRFLARLETPHKNWKFSESDVRESGHWDEYLDAYQDALDATSRPWAPWYAIPADDKPYAHLCVARVLIETLRSLDLRYPEPEEELGRRFAQIRHLLIEKSPPESPSGKKSPREGSSRNKSRKKHPRKQS